MALIPGAGVYDQQKAEAEAAYQRALATIAQQRGGILQDYGFNAQFDNNGNVTDYSVDPYNEYGLYQLSRRSQAADLNSAEEDARLRGFNPRKGFGHQGAEDMRFAQGYENLGLGRGFLQGIGGLAEQQAGALADKNQSMLGIEQDALYNALQNRLFNPAATGGEGGGIPVDNISDEDRAKYAIYNGRAFDSRSNLVKALKARGRNPGYWFQHHQGQANKLNIHAPQGKQFSHLKQQRAASAAKRFARAGNKSRKKREMLRQRFIKRRNKLGKKGRKKINRFMRDYRKAQMRKGQVPYTDGAGSLFDNDKNDLGPTHLSGPR